MKGTLLRRTTFGVALITFAAASLTGCSDPTEAARPIVVRNDTEQAVVLQICDSFGCDHLNDRLESGDSTSENVDTDEDPYEFRVVNVEGRVLGCLNVATHPLPTDPIAVSTVAKCHA